MRKKDDSKTEKSESKTPKKPRKAASKETKSTKKAKTGASKEIPEAPAESSASVEGKTTAVAAPETEGKPKPKQTRNSKGQFVKGSHSTGRASGAKGKYTNAREALQDQLMPFVNNLGELITAIKDPGDRANAIAKFLPFILPKYISTSITADVDRPISEEERLLELYGQYKKRETEINIKTLTIIDNDKPADDPTASTPAITDADLGI